MSYEMNPSFANQCSLGAEALNYSVDPQFIPIIPIGLFWDIENCQVPYNRSAITLVERIRGVVESQYRESEFQVVCDISKAHKQVIDDLNSSQVTVIHISCTAKNAADDKIKQLIHRFIETNGYQSAVLVITGMSLGSYNFIEPSIDPLFRRRQLRVCFIGSEISLPSRGYTHPKTGLTGAQKLCEYCN
jgi:hypothetical protein